MHELLVTGLVFLTIGMLGLLAVRRATRSVRRRLGQLAARGLGHLGALGRGPLHSSDELGRWDHRSELLARTSPAALLSWPLRLQTRRAVATAAYAVRTAEREGAAVGELPRVVGELAALRRVHDARMRAGGSTAGATEVLALATSVRSAADEALAAVGAARHHALPQDVADAAAGVRAGAAWLRAGSH